MPSHLKCAYTINSRNERSRKTSAFPNTGSSNLTFFFPRVMYARLVSERKCCQEFWLLELGGNCTLIRPDCGYFRNACKWRQRCDRHAADLMVPSAAIDLLAKPNKPIVLTSRERTAQPLFARGGVAGKKAPRKRKVWRSIFAPMVGHSVY